MNATSFQFSRALARPARLIVDPLLMSAALGLLLIGLVMVTSASISIADRAMGSPFAYLERQLLFALVGACCGLVAFVIPSAVWQRLSMPLLLIGLGLLVLVLIPGLGHAVNGSRRWLRLGMLNFQASELARLLILIYLASYAVRHQEELRETFVGVLKPLALLVLAALLLLLEPDFGAASVLLVTGFAVLFIAGMPWKYVLVVLGAGGLALGAVAVSSAYRVQRLTTFLDPWADPFNSGFQLTQSLIAIGRGEWLGVGLGASVQKLFYLPEAHTDFVFAVMAEEFGLAGVVVVLCLFALLVVRVCRIAQRAAQAGEMFQAYLAAAFAIWVGLQAFINIGVNMGMLPTKGLTLPLMSYGRSSLMVTLAWLGIVLRIHHESAAAGRLAVPRQDSRG